MSSNSNGGYIEKIAFHSLVCHSNVELTLTCIGSLLKHGGPRVNVVIHDDGTLDERDIERLQSGLQRTSIIIRKDADERIGEELRSYPACSAFRRETCMGLKLFDMMLYERSSVLRYSDADVYYVRDPTVLFRDPPPGEGFCFMTDLESAYSIRSWHFVQSPKLRLVQRVNAGLICANRNNFHLDFVEWFLREPKHQGNRHNGVAEQTAWAALGARAGCRLWSPRTVPMGIPNLVPDLRHYAVHFVGMYRHGMKSYTQKAERMRNDFDASNSEPELDIPRRCTPRHILAVEMRRTIGRAIDRVKR